jgi:CRISPR/Cas system-associated exonuclease Cas4 (RecB family)
MINNPQKKVNMNIEHISVSRGKSYKQCAYYYKLKYHDKIPNPGEEQFYFTYGKIVHKIAEAHVAEEGRRTLREISEDVLKGRIEIEDGKKAPPLPLDYRKRMPLHIKAIEKLNSSIGCKGITEKKFRYDLDPPHGKFVTGFIDRIIINDDKAWIIDYKTTKKGPYRENRQTIRHDPQLRVYSRVVQKEFGVRPENIKAALYYLEDAQILSASYDEESLANVESELLELYNRISGQRPEDARGSTGSHCQRCEYRDMCPFYSSTRRHLSWDGDPRSL